jgi:hypothetical protein
MNACRLQADAWILPGPRLFNEVVARRVFLGVEYCETEVLNDQAEPPRVLAHGRGYTFQIRNREFVSDFRPKSPSILWRSNYAHKIALAHEGTTNRKTEPISGGAKCHESHYGLKS